MKLGAAKLVVSHSVHGLVDGLASAVKQHVVVGNANYGYSKIAGPAMKSAAPNRKAARPSTTVSRKAPRKSKPLFIIMKSIIAAGLLLGFAHGSAIADLIANVEANIDRDTTVLEIHQGYSDSLGEDAAWYVQAGPAIIDSEAEFSGKAGVTYDVAEDVNLYGEWLS